MFGRPQLAAQRADDAGQGHRGLADTGVADQYVQAVRRHRHRAEDAGGEQFAAEEVGGVLGFHRQQAAIRRELAPWRDLFRRGRLVERRDDARHQLFEAEAAAVETVQLMHEGQSRHGLAEQHRCHQRPATFPVASQGIEIFELLPRTDPLAEQHDNGIGGRQLPLQAGQPVGADLVAVGREIHVQIRALAGQRPAQRLGVDLIVGAVAQKDPHLAPCLQEVPGRRERRPGSECATVGRAWMCTTS